MKTKSILLLVLIASAMIQVFVHFFFVYLCLFSFLHYLVETKDKNLMDNAVDPRDAKQSLPDQTDDNDYFLGWILCKILSKCEMFYLAIVFKSDS